MRYTVSIMRTDYGFVEVEAANMDEARDKAIEAEENGDAIWNNCDLEISEIAPDLDF